MSPRPLLVLCFALPAAGASAQEPARSAETIVAVRAPEMGRAIRVTSSAGPRLVGTFQGVEDGAMLLSADPPRRIPLVEVDTLWVRGHSAGTGALVGGAIGLAAGIAYGLLVGEVLCDGPDCDTSTLRAVALSSLLGVGAGAAGGALVGLAVPRWHRWSP